MINFEKMLKIGKEGEHEVARYLISKGVSVLPLYQFNNDKIPLLFTKNANLILPDLTCFKDSKVFFIEVKTKNRWVNYNGELETGLDERLYKQYLEVMKITGLDIYLIFNHKIINPIGFFTCNMKTEYRLWDGRVNGEYIQKPMVFYSYNKLIEL